MSINRMDKQIIYLKYNLVIKRNKLLHNVNECQKYIKQKKQVWPVLI
jgi:hypothetical protein